MNETTTTKTLIGRARAGWYRALAAAVRDPRSDALNVLDAQETWPLLEAGAILLREEPAVASVELAPGELSPEEFDPARLQSFWSIGKQRRAEFYDEVFGLVTSKECPPYETDYCPQTFSVHRSQQIADVAGFYRAFGLEPSRERRERADHIALELEFMAWLVEKQRLALQVHGPGSQQEEVCRDAQQRFLADHLAWWAPAFAFALRKRSDGLQQAAEIAAAPTSYLGAFARLLVSYIAIERALCEVPAPRELVAPTPTEEAPAACGDCSESA